jgi:membrane fusion protein (multidrug efflux system)
MTENNESKNIKLEKGISVALLVILIIALVVMGAWALNIVSAHLKSTSASFARDNNAPIPVKTVKVDKTPVKARLITQAILVENQELPIFPTANSMVKEVHVDVGDLVKKGDKLITFYSELLKAKVELARSMVEIGQEEYEDAANNFTKVSELFDKNLVGQDELGKASLTEKQAKSKWLNSQYELESAEFEYAQVELTAPVGGVVTEVTTFPNTLVRMNTAIITLSVTNPIYVEAKVAQRYFGDLSLGQSMAISLDAFPEQSFPSEILRIGNEVDQISDTLSVYAKLENPNLELRPGMGGVASIAMNADDNDNLRIPAIALLGSNGRSAYVFVVNSQGIAQLTKVSIVGYDQGYVGVRTGLKPGDSVVVVGQQALKDGDQVEASQ